MEQQIRFCTTSDGVRVAHATVRLHEVRWQD